MSYTIDGNAVNNRIDWRQKKVYGRLAGRRTEVFPGDGNIYVALDKKLPDGVVITGHLEHNTIADLTALMDIEAARVADTTLRTVALNGNSYLYQQLLSLDQLSGFIPFYDGANKIMIRVRFTWQGVRT